MRHGGLEPGWPYSAYFTKGQQMVRHGRISMEPCPMENDVRFGEEEISCFRRLRDLWGVCVSLLCVLP